MYAEAKLLMEAGSVAGLHGLAEPWTGYWPCCTTVLMGDGIVLYDLRGDDGAVSLADLTGDDRAGGGAGAPRVALILAEHAGDGAERGQGDLSGEAAGEPAGESEEAKEPPTPTGLAWPGTVIGAVGRGG